MVRWFELGLALFVVLLAAAALLEVTRRAGPREPQELEVELWLDPNQAAAAQATSVHLAGEFNDWSQTASPLERGPDGVWRITVRLRPGVYRYKFVAGERWVSDPHNPLREPGGHRNSVLVVGCVPVPDLGREAEPRPREGRPGAFQRVEAAVLPAPPGGLEPRPLYVYLPPSYEREPARRYPVLYLHDGQNVWSDPDGCFGHGGWYLDTTCERLWREGALPELILVGVPNSPARMREYAPDLAEPRAAPYLRYLVEVVKPFVDGRYRTRPERAHTAIMGSSLGGLISFVGALSYPEVFGQAACLSSSFWFEDAGGRDAFELLARTGRPEVRLYVDSGTAGPSQDGAPGTRKMAEALRAAGWEGPAFEHFEAEGATHDEGAWRARAERPLRFLFPVAAGGQGG
ncbi:MAG: alpha/beta hydrolase-fold protein [Planctomycetota bacterium]